MSFFAQRRLKRLGVTPTHRVTTQRKLNVPTPDGAQLQTDLYLGRPRQGAPVIMIRSPYGRRSSFAFAAYAMASQGFNVVMQSCRGTFGSTGQFDPHHDEQRDGLATIAWIKQQPWYGGAMATFGPSYLGYTQWAVAAAARDDIHTMIMQVTMSDFAQMSYCGDSFMLENSFSWTRMMSVMRKSRLHILKSLLLGKMKVSTEQWHTLPLSAMDKRVAGEHIAFWQDWMHHDSSRDPWWAPMSYRATASTLPQSVSMLAGWYDIFLPFQIRDFVELQKSGSDIRLTIGAWRHSDRALADAGLIDAVDVLQRKFGSENQRSALVEPDKRVKLYVVGANEWRYFDAWPPRESKTVPWYLQSQQQLAESIAAQSAADGYRYDPADPTPSVGGPGLGLFRSAPFAVDNAELEARADVLIYTSEVMRRAVDIIGPVTADLYVSSSAASADFFVRLCDVDEKGMSKNICDGLQRVAIARSDVPQQVHVEMWPTAYRIAAGHRLRVQISSGAFPRWARNLGGGEPLASATTMHIAEQSIHHSPEYPSAINLPICEIE